MLLYVIRHGETMWNAERRLQGHSGSDLNENGILLAGITARALAEVSFNVCYSSPAVRAMHTAKILLEGRDVEIHEEPRLLEIGFGVWEGRSLDPSNPNYLRFPGKIPQFLHLGKDALDYQPPEGGESLRDLIERTGEFYRELTADPSMQDKTILISTHGAAGRAFLNPLFEDRSDFWQGQVPQNCSVSIVEIRDGNAQLKELDRIYYPSSYIRHYYSAPDDKTEGTHTDEDQ